jgi:hypothetical protein
MGVALPAEAQYVKASVASFTTASATYVDVTGGTVSFTPVSATDIWILLFSARIMSSSTTPLGSVEARYLVNGVEHGMGGTENTPTPNQPGPWTSFYRVTGTTATQTVQVQLRDIAGTGTIEKLQIIAFKLPEGADFHYSETESDTVVPTGFSVYESLTINPSSPGEYLVMGLMTGSEGPGTQALYIRFKDPVGNYWPPEHEPGVQVWDYYITPSQMFQSFFVARTQTLSGSATYQLEVDGSSDPNSTIRYTRFMAFRTDAFENFESVEDVATSSTTSTTPVVKSQLETSLPPVTRDYIVLQHLSAAVPSGFTGLRQIGFEADNAVTMSYDHSQQSQFYTAGYAFFDAETTDRVVTYENTIASSTGNEIRAKESVIHVLRLPSTTYDAHRLIGFETGDLSEMAAAGGGASADAVTVCPGSGGYSLKEGSTSTLASGLSPAIDTFAMRFSFMKPTDPGALQTLVQLRNGATNLWSLALTTGGQLQVQQQEAIGLGTTTGFTVLENNRWYTIRIVYDRAAGGALRVLVFDALDIDTTHGSAGSAVDTTRHLGAPESQRALLR